MDLRPKAHRWLPTNPCADRQPQKQRPLLASISRLAYGCYVWAVLLTLGTLVWPIVSSVRNQRFNWFLTRAAGLLLTRLSGISLDVTGSIPNAKKPYVLVANHASFIDGMVLIMSSPKPIAIVAGGELATQRLAGPFLRGLGCEFVLSRDDRRGTANMERFTQVLRSGRNLAIFPEASLGSAPGLRRFHLGAFTIAAEAAAEVLPIGIKGSREIVPPGKRLPAPGKVQVNMGEPIAPKGAGLAAVIALRDRARLEILRLSGEEDLLGQAVRPKGADSGEVAQLQE